MLSHNVWKVIFVIVMNANFVHTSQTTSLVSQENTTMTSFTHGNISGRKRPIPMSDKRISGGTLVEPNSWPFLVALSDYFNETNFHFCGGTIYNESYIITAAHCLRGTDMQYLNVTAGEHSLNETEDHEQMRAVSMVIKHPGYNVFHDHDIALLQLSSPLDLKTAYVTAIEINTDMSCPAPNDNCTSAGWGEVERDWGSEVFPSEVVLSAMSNQECSMINDSTYRENILSFHVCAWNTVSGDSPCSGDSGGPLVCTCGGTKKLVGVVSWGKGCGRLEYPDVFTRVSCYHEWIQTRLVNYPCKSGNINIMQSKSGSHFVSLGNSIVFLCILHWCATFPFSDHP